MKRQAMRESEQPVFVVTKKTGNYDWAKVEVLMVFTQKSIALNFKADLEQAMPYLLDKDHNVKLEIIETTLFEAKIAKE